MKITYYLPPKGENKVWFRAEMEGEGKFLDSDGVVTEITNETQLQEVKEKQNEIYCNLYPKLCINKKHTFLG